MLRRNPRGTLIRRIAERATLDLSRLPWSVQRANVASTHVAASQRTVNARLRGVTSQEALSVCVLGVAVGCALPEMQMVHRESGASGKAGANSIAIGSAGRSQGGAGGTVVTNATAGSRHTNNGGSAGVLETADPGAIQTAGAASTATPPNEGGASASGGAPSTEETTPSDGGTSSSSTAPSNGGASAIGGAPSTGGFSTGGTPSSGSTPASNGGTSANAGAPAGAGAPTGGISAGGAPNPAGSPGTGGVATGGVATGGVATGGVATGGAATGGIPATGLPFVPPTALSCQNLTTTCQGESCCTSITIPGGTFPMGRSEATNGMDYYLYGYSLEIPQHDATVADFALDKYEVTAARFRTFVGKYDQWHKTDGHPKVTTGIGTGGHPIAPNTGWGQSWTAAVGDLPTDSTALIEALKCDSTYQTWKDAADTNEAYPINCVTWYMAFAFCIWDGGRLPTEAEWEYAAAGGVENRLYPWGRAVPRYDNANYYHSSPAGSAFTAVGGKLTTGGVSYFGPADLAGSMWEWTFDWYNATYYGTAGTAGVLCDNCASATAASSRVLRGGSWLGSATNLRAAYRYDFIPVGRGNDIGFRCARTPQ